ncbi:MAG: tRNA pseudouridine(55) synthase TruB [Endomicrobium sp.]|jgi:tRNA pseudouridine55 synthase|nr:tRNA pseudouridine(55) synthase TruB [Endomicrobium sp.]
MPDFCETLQGLLLFDKPAGITSFTAVHQIKKILNVKKAGHCGTLDPAATGLLLILTGKSTKLQDCFMKKDKVYRTSFLLGTATDTNDLDGAVVCKKDFSGITADIIEKALDNFRGEILQTPPMYSAIKHKGQKLYELARKGITVERKPRKVFIKEAKLLSYDNGTLDLRIECSSGTYIRSIAHDLGEMIECGAAVASLRREKIGNYDVKDAITQKDFDDKEKIIAKIIKIEKQK